LQANVAKNCCRDKRFTICQFSYCLQPNNAYVKSSYFAQKCINFHLQPSEFEKFSRERNPRTPGKKGRGGRGIKGFHALKEGEKRREGRVWREGKVEERRASRSEGAMAILLQAVAAPGGQSYTGGAPWT